MSDIRLSIDTSRLRPDFADFGEASLVASVRGINRTLANVKTVMVRAIAKSLRLKQGAVRDRIRILEATRSRPVARMYADNAQIPVEQFNARGPLPSRGKGRGVTANTEQRRYPHAFRARMESGHVGVFERVPGKFMRKQRPGRKPRQAIRELRTASVAAVFIKHAPVGQARADEQLPKNLESELRFALRSRR